MLKGCNMTFGLLIFHCPQLKYFLSKAVLQRIQEWSDKMPAPKFVFFLKLWIVVDFYQNKCYNDKNIFSKIHFQHNQLKLFTDLNIMVFKYSVYILFCLLCVIKYRIFNICCFNRWI